MSDQIEITWQISPQTYRTEARAKAMQRAILDACPDADQSEVREFVVLISGTKGLTFDERTARPALKRFKQFVEHDAAEMTGTELWDYHDDVPTMLWQPWIKAFNDGQKLFDTDPAELPNDALTPEQKAEAATPGSPLA